MKLSILYQVALVLALGFINNAMAEDAIVVHNMGDTEVTVHLIPHTGGSQYCKLPLLFNNINPGKTKTQRMPYGCGYGSAKFYEPKTGASWGQSDINQIVYAGNTDLHEHTILWVNNSQGGQWGIGVQK